MTDSIEVINYSRHWENVETNLDKCSIQIVLNEFLKSLYSIIINFLLSI